MAKKQKLKTHRGAAKRFINGAMFTHDMFTTLGVPAKIGRWYFSTSSSNAAWSNIWNQQAFAP